MINFNTPPKEIVRELSDEERKALFWLKKYYHGEKGYEKMRDGLLSECYHTKKTAISDVVEYISPHGNRWMAFECCQYYKAARQANTVPMAFCYYETYGSVGAYLLGRSSYDTTGQNNVVLHFTNHFFLRFCQRLGIEMRSRWMVQRFVEVIPGFLIGSNGLDDKGRRKFDVRLPASIGRGIMIEDAPIVEIRTYLTDKELNNKQLKETETLRQMYERQTFEPINVRMNRIARSDDFANDLSKEVDNVADMAGIDKELLSIAMSMRVMVTRAIADLGYVDVKDINRWKDIGERTKDIDFLDFVTDYEKGGGMEKAKLLYETICKFGIKSGIKGYDAVKMTDRVLEIWKESITSKDM